MFADPNPPHALLENDAIDSWLSSLLGPPGVGEDRVVVRIGGERTDQRPQGFAEDERETIRELMDSLARHSGVKQGSELQIAAPPAVTVRRALSSLADPEARRATLGAALNIFGRRAVAPMEKLLAAGDGSARSRLGAWRASVLASMGPVGLASETQRIVRADLDALLTDEYLAMLAENEERVLRPRLQRLAHDVLELFGAVFFRALGGLDARADRIADGVVRRLPAQMALRAVPGLLENGFVEAIAEFLEVEARAELAGALATLTAKYADVVAAERPLAIDDDWFRDVARECWRVIATRS